MMKSSGDIRANVIASSKKANVGKRLRKEGVPLEHTRKHSLETVREGKFVGINVGVTLNMGDYESLRVDAWGSDALRKDEQYSEAFERIRAIVTEALVETVNELKENYNV